MSKRVDIGNGYFANFPDDATPDEIEGALNQHIPLTGEAAPKTPADTVDAIKAQPTDKAAARARRSALAETALQVYSATLGVGQGFFGVGDYAGAAGKMVHGLATGAPVAPQEAFQQARSDREAVQAQAPAAAIAGNIGGLVAGGSALTRQLPSLALKAGQTVGNVGRLALGGEAAGGLQAAGESGGDTGAISGGVALGGVGGPVGGAVGKVAGAVAQKLGGSRAVTAVKKLAANFALSPDEMTTALDNFATQNGRQASLSDIADLQSRGMLKQFASKNPAFGAAVANEVEARGTQLPKYQQPAPQAFNQANQAQDVTSLAMSRNDAMSAKMGSKADPNALRNQPVATTAQVNALLSTPRVARALSGDPELQEAVNDILSAPLTGQSGGAVTPRDLTVDDFDNLRQQLTKAQTTTANSNSIRAAKIGDINDELQKFAATRQPAYKAALDQYRSESNYADAFQHGRTGKALTNVEDPALRKALLSPEGQKGYKLGNAERVSAENLEAAAPGHIAPAPQQGVGTAQHAALAAINTAHGSPYAWYHYSRLIPALKTDDRTLRLAAQYLSQPSMARQGVALLKRSGATDADITRLAAAVGGAAGGQTQ